jgi:dipeptidyl aminopeptidase/acylaminoacyl peptidase
MRRVWLVLVGLLVVIVVLSLRLSRMARPAPAENPNHLAFELPNGYRYGGGGIGRQLDISPDGKTIVYVADSNTDRRKLYQHTVGQSTHTQIAGTEFATDPSISPDGRYVAFYADRSIKKAALDGNGVSVIAKVPPMRGIAWLGPDTLVIGIVGGALQRVPMSGDGPSPLVETEGPQLPHLSPSVLPGNKAILFTRANGPLVNARIGVLDLTTGKEHELLDENAFAARYTPTGHIVFVHGDDRELMAVRFDLGKLETVGTPQRVLEAPLAGRGSGGSTDYSFSNDGTLVYTQRREESIDDVLAQIGSVDLTKIYIQPNWFEELKRLVP